MLRKLVTATGLLMLVSGAAYADPIVGNWRTESGERASITGGGSFSIVIKSGKNAGKNIGRLKATGNGNYSGTVRDPNDNNKAYSGKAHVSGNTLTLSGCVLGGLVCKNQSWSRL